jgi:hypothetical protein
VTTSGSAWNVSAATTCEDRVQGARPTLPRMNSSQFT